MNSFTVEELKQIKTALLCHKSDKMTMDLVQKIDRKIAHHGIEEAYELKYHDMANKIQKIDILIVNAMESGRFWWAINNPLKLINKIKQIIRKEMPKT